MRLVRVAVLGILGLVGAGSLRAQDSVPVPAEARPTGLPKRINWQFGLTAGLGTFGFDNSLYTDVRPDPSGDLSDNWVESYFRPALTADYPLGDGTLYGGLSVAGERTFAAPPPVVGAEASSFQVDDAFLGWRSGTALGSHENLLDVKFGRAQYTLGKGMLLWDGGGEGGSRGGFWSNARKAWALAGVARLSPGAHAFEGFYLDRDEVPESETGTRLWGANYEFTPNERNTLGATYMSFNADSLPLRDGLTVLNFRAYLAPLRSLPGLTFQGEYAREENDNLLESTAWTAQAAWQFDSMGWQPRLSYRYAFFEGDDPATPIDEAFDPLIPGFSDWGAWWQGEIAGEYFLSNSNLITHQVRLHLTPSDALSTGIIGFVFQLDQPATFAPGVTSSDIATEVNFYADWQLNSNFLLSAVLAFNDPQEAAEQGFGRTSNFTYGMLYLAYSY